MTINTLLFAACLLAVPTLGCKNATTASQLTPPANPTPIRGVWLPASDSDALFSRDNIRRMVDDCARHGINHLFVVTWTGGFTQYPSAVMQRTFGKLIDPRFAGRDPLQEVIEEAHKRNIKVYAWFEFGFAADYSGINAHILTQKPDWAARSADGSVTTKNGFRWMNALNPAVQSFMLDMITEVVSKYDVDGIQGDDRLPAMPTEGGYDVETKNRYTQETGNNVPTNAQDTAWVAWRANQLTDFLRRLTALVKRTKPACQVSMAPSVYPFSLANYLQDWPSWVKNGSVDMVAPQIYRRDLTAYQNELNKIVNTQVSPAQKALVVPGMLLKVGSYVAPDTLLRQQINANRAAGLPGEIFFHYEGTRTRTAFFEGIYN
ncbi:family 10 glycosylhydrolase [Fibrella sp. HMF5335]|uniref:Family 10 glycosylhydrolase n=1 Tax=Fibrella rubiginis TaxID=2817060 RepID=A0A939K393_9BACT|nr:family 10 glycosylhydrolase [Fibrella rubiginis]MBO0939007.1 family 10 glycosylhydrolase [Fibrella rubiginis]